MVKNPFGFSNSNQDKNNDNNNFNENNKNENSNSNNNFFSFNLGGFEKGAFANFFNQIGNFITNSAPINKSAEKHPVNYGLATWIAKQKLHQELTPNSSQLQATINSVKLADLLLNSATFFPANSVKVSAWSSLDWLNNSLTAWKEICNPIAEKMATAWVTELPEEAKVMAHQLKNIIAKMGGFAYGMQLGNYLGELAKKVLNSTDIIVPINTQDSLALLPINIENFAKTANLPQHDVLVFLAAKEAAHKRLFTHAPWLKSRIIDSIEQYANGMEYNITSILDSARDIDILTKPEELQKLLSNNIFEPKITPNQTVALNRIEVLLALIEGWLQVVVESALKNKISTTYAITEVIKRRRATQNPAEQTFGSLIGLELSPERINEAAKLWQKLSEITDIKTRDKIWDHPDLLPTKADIENSASFIDRIIGGDTSVFTDPIADIETLMHNDSPSPEAESDSD